MNKILFLFSSVLVISLVTCMDLPLDEKDRTAVDATWTEDWAFMTVYLDGRTIPGKSIEAGRAMNIDTARIGFDYFEVVFYYNSPSPRVARSSWEIGDKADIYNVYKTSGGVDYSQTKIGAAYTGSALLFAGRHDRTILAFGRIYSVDDVKGAVIYENSAKVTFQIFPLTAQASYLASKSSFLTAYGNPGGEPSEAGTKIVRATIGGRSFPMYILPPGRVMKAQFEFKVESLVKGELVTWNEFKDGVLIAEGGKGGKREARYPAGNGRYWLPVYPLDERTTVRMTNNQIAEQPIQNPVTFDIDTSNAYPLDSANGIFMLILEIPVYCMTDYGFSSQGVMWDEAWYIRTAYTSYGYNIDNGVDSTGGALLMGVTEAKDFEVNRIKG